MIARFSIPALLLASTACSEVRVVDDGDPPITDGPPLGGFVGNGGGGLGPSDGGFVGNGGAGLGPSDGGFGTGGAPAPSVVPGCEALELVGQPVLIPGPASPPFDKDALLTELDGERLGLLYLNGSADLAELRSRTIDGAFQTWPPVVTEASTQYDGFSAGPSILDSALPSGLFSLKLGSGQRGIYSFDQAGALRTDVGWDHVFIYPGVATPFDAVTYDSNNLSYRLLSFDSLEQAVPSSDLDIPVIGCRTTRMALGEGGPLFSIATDYYCEDSPHVDFFKKSSASVSMMNGFDLPATPGHQSLSPRPGGYWYFASDEVAGSYAYPLDENGIVVGEPWHDPYVYGGFEPQFLPWHEGFVGSHREDGQFSLFVSDGYNRTDSFPIPGTESFFTVASGTPLAVVVGGEDSDDFVLAYPTSEGILLARLECVTPFK